MSSSRPVVALVGRPNVGKSTLFNRFVGSRQAIVADWPGVTRDRQYGDAHYAGTDFILIDTGGVGGLSGDIAHMTADQVTMALDEADIILFMVDAKAGCLPADVEWGNRLRSDYMAEKAVYLCVNKSDREVAAVAAADFYALGLGEPQVISASRGRGCEALVESMFAHMSPQIESAQADDKAADLLAPACSTHQLADGLALGLDEVQETAPAISHDAPIAVALIGRPNVGKSTLTNRLLGEDRVIVMDKPGTTIDSIAIPLSFHGTDYTLIDTAGVRRKRSVTEGVEHFSVVKTMQAIDAADVVCLLLDARAGISEQDQRLLGLAVRRAAGIVIAVNKWERMRPDQRRLLQDEIDRLLGFIDFAPIVPISALHGSGCGDLMQAVKRVRRCQLQAFSTPALTRVLNDAVVQHEPPLIRGRRIKLRYAHLGGRHPLTIVIHGKQLDTLPASYQRYLSGRYRKTFRLKGVPVKIECRTDENPYKNSQN